MRRARLAISIAVAVSLAYGFAVAQSVYGGGDGSSVESAVVIYADSGMDGTASVYQRVRSNYPGWQVKRQALIGRSGRRYDRLTIVSPSGQEKDIYFDVTRYFGKL